MAERRMFAKAVIGSGKFLRMPATARLLYYDLGMEADDDGVVEAFRVMRTTGATDDDLKILVAKGFIRVLNEELVVLICDWNVNNYIQKDRYHRSLYAGLLENMDTTCIQPVYNMDTRCTQGASEVYTEVRLGKDSIGKVSQGESISASDDAKPARAKKKTFAPPTVDEVKAYCDEQGFGTINPAAFVDYYEANGWRVGSQSMKDWRATVRNWARRDKEKGIVPKSAGSFETEEFVDAAVKASYAKMEQTQDEPQESAPVEELPEPVVMPSGKRDYSGLWSKIM